MAVRNYYKEFAYGDSIYPTSKDLERHILKLTSDSLQYQISELFEKIILYDLGIESANMEKLTEGKFKLKIKLRTKKYEADNQGYESDLEFQGSLVIEVYNKSGAILNSHLRKLRRNESIIEIILTEEPGSIKIDLDMV